jgi:hypothetical protein
MKLFKDLEFKQKPIGGTGAIMQFDNGFTISVQAGSFAYSTPREDMDSPDDFTTFEIAIFGPPSGDFVTKEFMPELDDDVLGWQSREQINTIMIMIQNHGK